MLLENKKKYKVAAAERTAARSRFRWRLKDLIGACRCYSKELVKIVKNAQAGNCHLDELFTGVNCRETCEQKGLLAECHG